MLVMRTFRPDSNAAKKQFAIACLKMDMTMAEVLTRGIQEYIATHHEPRKREFFLRGFHHHD